MLYSSSLENHHWFLIFSLECFYMYLLASEKWIVVSWTFNPNLSVTFYCIRQKQRVSTKTEYKWEQEKEKLAVRWVIEQEVQEQEEISLKSDWREEEDNETSHDETLLAAENLRRRQCEKWFQMVMERRSPQKKKSSRQRTRKNCFQEGDMNKEGKRKLWWRSKNQTKLKTPLLPKSNSPSLQSLSNSHKNQTKLKTPLFHELRFIILSFDTGNFYNTKGVKVGMVNYMTSN